MFFIIESSGSPLIYPPSKGVEDKLKQSRSGNISGRPITYPKSKDIQSPLKPVKRGGDCGCGKK